MRFRCDQDDGRLEALDYAAERLPVRLWLRLAIAGGEIAWDIHGAQGLESLRSGLLAGELGPVTISRVETLALPVAA